MTYITLRSFLKSYDRYSKNEQELIIETIKEIKNYLETNQSSYGLRIKRLSSMIYEARINIHLRIMYFREKDVVKFFCLGNHDDIRRCLKNLQPLKSS